MIAAVTGLVAGTLHVWSGPDHLAAIAPLAARSRTRPWLAGIRWGLGHSTGVALVGLFSLWLRELLPLSLLSGWGERLVGVMLIGIGLWGLRKAFRARVHVHGHTHDGETHVHIHTHEGARAHEAPEAHLHAHAAFGIGILHGLAGSSHFLGVLPALAFPTLSQAVAYIIAYGVGTILSMGFFSTFLGWLAGRIALGGAAAYRGLMVLCSSAALLVGAFWLAS